MIKPFLSFGMTAAVLACAHAVHGQVPGLPGDPTANGLTPRTDTMYVNTPDTVNNGNTESLGVAIADNGNVIVGWEDDHDDDTSLQYIAAAWTIFNSSGAPVTPATAQTSLAVGGSTTSRFLSYFRTDGSAVVPFTSWGPKIKANLFGGGLGMGGTSYALGAEVTELAAIQNNAAGDNAGDFPSVQLLSSTGSPVKTVSGVPDAYAERDGDIRVGDWDYLANGNILVVGESRQGSDLVDIYGGESPQNHVIYRIVNATGAEVKAVSLGSEFADKTEMWHGSAVTRNGFALRFGSPSGAAVRLFNNDGTPASTNINLAALTGHPITGGGGRGDGVGFHGNGNDAYAAVNVGNDEQGVNSVWVTVLNANGTVRYSKSVSEDVAITGASRADVAIDETGRVLVAYDAQLSFDDGATLVRLVMGRLLDQNGNFLGGTFYVSEKELPAAATLEARRPRAAFRGNLAAITWESFNSGAPEHVVALRLFSIGGGGGQTPGLPSDPAGNGLTPKTDTLYVNTPNTVNNGNTESLGVAIADNGNVMVGWEDDHDDDTSLQYIAAAWTIYNSSGAPVTPATAQTSLAVGGSTTNRFLSYFRADGSAVVPFTSWGPKIKANLFGGGLGMGGTSYALGAEVPELAAIQDNAAGDNAGDFPSVQLVSSTGSPVKTVSGVPDAYAERDGDIRIGDWDYLANGNILVVGESRQGSDLVDIYGGESPQNHVIYRVVNASGAEVKAVSLASEVADKTEMWHGSGVTRNGFALRFGSPSGAAVRLFNNDGTPASTNINLAALTGHPITGGGGRGDGVGFHGNGNDAYAVVNVGTDAQGTNAVWVTVLNTNGTVRYSKSVSADVAITGLGRADVAIDETGRVLVAYDAQLSFDDGATLVRLVMGRLLDRDGNFLGGTFYASEKELPAATTLEARRPRAALRGNLAAITWESLNSGAPEHVVALRLFSIGGGAGGNLVAGIQKASASTIRLTWTGGNGPFTVQKKAGLADPNWTTVQTTPNREVVVPSDGTTGFFRVAGAP